MTAYITKNEVVSTGGIYKDIVDEAVGTGDTTTKAFSLAQQKINDGSLIVKVNGVTQTETTDYTVDYLEGDITFVTAPAAFAITASYWYYTITINDDVVDLHIAEAEELVTLYTGREWSTQTATSEKHDSDDQEYLYTEYFPIQSVTTLTVDGTSITPSTLAVYGDIGKVQLTNDSEKSNFSGSDLQSTVITYVYGEATTPEYIKSLARKIAAKNCLIELMGGTYDDVTSGRLREMEYAVGEPYMNMLRTIERLDKEITLILKHVKKQVSVR